MEKAQRRPKEKKLEFETVERTITVKLPVKFDEWLQTLAKTLSRTVESIIQEDLYSVLENFFEGGYAQGWMEHAVDMDEGRKLDKQVSQIADQIFDC